MTEHEEIYFPPLLQYLIFVLYLVCVLGFPIMGGILSYLDNQEHKASENKCVCSCCGQQFKANK